MYQNSYTLKFFALVFALVTATPVICAGENRNSSSNESSLIIDTTAPPGHLTKEQERQWEHQQREIWRHADEHFNHIQQGSRFFQQNQYREALQEYMQAARKAAISPELLQAKEHVAITLEALGEFTEALSEIDFLIQQTLNERVKQDDLRWKEALDAASKGQYAVALQYYRNRFATAKDWEKKSYFLEQRLHLIEDRARAAGQLPIDDVKASGEPHR